MSELPSNISAETRSIMFLNEQGLLFPFGRVPSRLDFQRWRLEAVKNNIVTSLSCSRKGEYRLKLSGDPVYSDDIYVFGLVPYDESQTTSILSFVPHSLDGKYYADRLLDFGSIQENAAIYIPAAPLTLEALLHPDVEPFARKSLSRVNDDDWYIGWRDFIDHHACRMTPDTASSLYSQLELSPAALNRRNQEANTPKKKPWWKR